MWERRGLRSWPGYGRGGCGKVGLLLRCFHESRCAHWCGTSQSYFRVPIWWDLGFVNSRAKAQCSGISVQSSVGSFLVMVAHDSNVPWASCFANFRLLCSSSFVSYPSFSFLIYLFYLLTTEIPSPNSKGHTIDMNVHIPVVALVPLHHCHFFV